MEVRSRSRGRISSSHRHKPSKSTARPFTMSVLAKGCFITHVSFSNITGVLHDKLTLYESNKMFSTRADQMISCDLFDTGSEEHGKRRRPDRILGFHETGSFSRRLEKYNLTAGRSENEAGFESILGALKSTVLSHTGKSLLFPFLIIEAKKRDGASFDDCNMQSALPILEMLQVQEDMQRKSQMTLEYGGPLVWYIAYRGEDWRLSGCYISEKPGPASYVSSVPTVVCDIANSYKEIVTLWTGQLNDVESALQLLLIIDYIFDWARDIYRPSLISQLEVLAKEPSEDDDNFTAMDTDSDIFSLAKPRKHVNVEDWATALEHDTETVGDEEHDVMKWAAHDSEFGVFRPACIVQNIFRCLFVTKANIDALFSVVTKPYTVKQLTKQATRAIGYGHTVLVSEDVLDKMEEHWTNRVRPNKTQRAPETTLFASIVYHTVVTSNWELHRILFCLVFDAEALSKVKDYTKKTSPLWASKNAKRFTRSNAETLILSLKDQSIQENLASALASTRQVLSRSAGASDSNPCPTFEFRDIAYVENGWGELKTYELINRVYDWCRKNSEEPTESFLRVSHQWNSLTSSSTGSTVASYFPNAMPATGEQYALVAQYHRYSRITLCIYVTPGFTEAIDRLRETLDNAFENDVLYKYSPNGLVSNNWKDVCQKWRTTDSASCKEIMEIFQKWKQGMPDDIPTSLPVAFPTTGKAKVRAVDNQPLPPQTLSSNASSIRTATPTLDVPVLTEVEFNRKRLREDADVNDGLPIQKKVKDKEIIIID